MNDPEHWQLIPRGICNWDYDVRSAGESLGQTTIEYGECGTISLPGQSMRLERQGPVSGEWTVKSADFEGVVFKPDALRKTLEMDLSGEEFTLNREPFMTRRMVLSSGSGELAVIQPEHAMTRRGEIRSEASTPHLIRMVAIWFAILTWRRMSQANASAAG